MALDLYSNARVSLFHSQGGGLLTEESSVTVDKKSGLNMVMTTAKGLAGATQGATTTEISIDNAVPSKDFEMNPDAFMRTGEVVEVQIEMAGRVSIHKCFMTDCTYSHSVNDASKLSMKLTGRFADFE